MAAPHHRSAESSVLDAYPVRIMLGLVVTLTLLCALVNLPVSTPAQRVGWSTQSSTEQIVLSDVRTEDPPESPVPTGNAEAPPRTAPHSSEPEEPVETTASKEPPPDTGSTSQDSPFRQTYREVKSAAELGVSDGTPQIVGGAGNLYLHIQYPRKAQRQGIEGHLELEFTVQADGSVKEMQVVKSLHPLCDSAAVRGVRSVEFVPAKQNGEPIPIRLRLPVEFRLTTVMSTAPTGG